MSPIAIYDDEQPSYAGGTTFCRLPLARVAELKAGQIAIIGAPIDEGVGTRPGARYGPRAIRQADDGAGPPQARRSIETGIRPFTQLDVVDCGDIPAVSGDPQQTLELLHAAVLEIARRGARPVILGGDHSIAYATIAAIAERNGPPRVVQFDTHTDTAPPGPGRPPWSHGSPMRRLVDEGILPGEQLLQWGLRGWWPGEDEIAWAHAHGVRSWTALQIHVGGHRAALDELLDALPSDGLAVWLSVDVDVLDPSVAPGTGTPEPGGLAAWQLLDAVAQICSQRPIAGLEMVEVSPPYDQSEITAMIAHRVVLESLGGIASYENRARSAR